MANAADPEQWLVLPELGLYTGVLICGAIGSGKTSACMRPFARQLLGWQAEERRRRIAGLVLEVEGDFCHQVRGILTDAGRADDYIELGLGGRCVNEALRRIRKARKPSERGGIVWHTQGSGKSLTMLWLALKLRRDEAQQQPTVVIVTDRTKLDRRSPACSPPAGSPIPSGRRA